MLVNKDRRFEYRPNIKEPEDINPPLSTAQDMLLNTHSMYPTKIRFCK